VPDSHKRDWRFEYLEKDGYKTPAMLEDVEKLGGILVHADPGTLLIFNERLPHGGAINSGDRTRVSSKIILVRISQGQKLIVDSPCHYWLL